MKLHECNECHKEEPIKTNQVLQINNPADVVIFHTKEITPEQGDDSEDSPVRPEHGEYRNMLVKYLANKHAYMYNSDGVFTQVAWGDLSEDATNFDMLTNRPLYNGQPMTHLTNIPDVSAVEQTLTEAIEAEAQERREEVDTVAEDLATETTNRTNADTALSEAIDQEAETRSGETSALETSIDTVSTNLATEATSRQSADTALGTRIDNETTARTSADTTLTNSVTAINTAINKDVLQEITLTHDTSTDIINVESNVVNIKSGATSSASIPFPVANTTTAGVMNAATYQGLQNTTNAINAFTQGSVAVTGLPASPTQAQITSAWKTATGLTDLINRASVYDQTNSKIWTYYTNTETWYETSAGGGSVQVSQWTNSSAGIVKGSTDDGQIFAETDGTGSVNGWDPLKNAVTNNSTSIASLQTDKVDKISGKGLSTNDYTTAEKEKLAYLQNYDDTEIQADIAALDADKVDKVTGKGLSTNDYTTAEKTKLAGIASGAEVNVQSDYNQTNTSADDYIKNKPTLGSLAAKNTISTNDISNTAITSGKIDWTTLPLYQYSETEQDTKTVWLEGQKIYQKVIKSNGFVGAGGTQVIDTGITFSWVVSAIGVALDASGNYFIPVPWTQAYARDVTDRVDFFIEKNGKVTFRNLTSSGKNFYIIVRYTHPSQS